MENKNVGTKKRWTKEEEEYVLENYGRFGTDTIARKLQRTERAIQKRANLLGINCINGNYEYITTPQLLNALGYNSNSSAVAKRWIEQYKMPVVRVKKAGKMTKVINLDEFWKWCEENQDVVNFRRFEKYMLGAEPEWVKEKREYDIKNGNNYSAWTDKEDNKLRKLINAHYSWEKIAIEMNRSVPAIKSRTSKLKIIFIPQHENSKRAKYTDEEKDIIEKNILKVKNYEELSHIVKTKNATKLKGYVSRKYGTESLSKIREKMYNQEGYF